MQMIRLKKEIDDVYVEDELSRMVIKKQLTEEEAEVVDVKKLQDFIILK